VPTSDDGFWRRCLPFRWKVQLTPAEQREQPFDLVVDALLAEAPGILNWMIDGALEWLTERTLRPSLDSEETKESYRNSSDPFGEWYRTRCVTGNGDDETLREKGRDLHADFKAFCEDELGIDGAKVPGERAFGTLLDERQHRNRKSNGNKYRLGIRLKTAHERDSDALVADAGAAGGGGAGDDEWIPPEFER
jgi:putative DNA primase/helicase